jgi:hypothetical protein
MIGVMGFVRSQRRWGAWAGLAALALQIVLSFGHMHREDLGLSALPALNHDHLAASAAFVPSAPAEQDRHSPPDVPDDYCAVCASMALVATAIPSLPPALIVPVPVRYVWPAQTIVRGASVRLALSFQARGPPSI